MSLVIDSTATSRVNFSAEFNGGRATGADDDGISAAASAAGPVSRRESAETFRDAIDSRMMASRSRAVSDFIAVGSPISANSSSA